MHTLLEDWVGAKIELPGLLAPVANGPAACVFWMTLRFHYFFQAAKTQAGQGPPVVPCMTELTEQVLLHIFAQMAPPYQHDITDSASSAMGTNIWQHADSPRGRRGTSHHPCPQPTTQHRILPL